jgi:dienelactone hydrolase
MNPDSLQETNVTRRCLFNGLLLAGGLSGMAHFAVSSESDNSQLGRDPDAATGADIGTLYSQIKFLADRCEYPLSFLNREYADPREYRVTIQHKVLELLHYDASSVDPEAEIVDRWETEHFVQEKILFNTTPWFRVPAYVLIPKGFEGKRPAIVDLHCHAGAFAYGKEKVMPVRNPHPALVELVKQNYEGRSTSAELARRGYVVISIDRFYFGERRTLFDDMNSLGMDLSKYTVDQIRQLNRRAGQGESTLARALFWAGTTWHGIAHWDDMRTVDYLVSRHEVDAARIGCMGISMGSDRANYLCALDDRIQCAVSVGWVSTLRPLIKAHINTHSFSHFLPGLTRFMDLPDMLGAFVPKPLMVLQCAQDGLYTLAGMEEANEKLRKIYDKAGVADKFAGKFFDMTHRFTIEMQEEAFRWFDRYLKG